MPEILMARRRWLDNDGEELESGEIDSEDLNLEDLKAGPMR